MKLAVTFTQEEIDKAKQSIKEGKSFCHAIHCNYKICGMCPLADLSNDRAIKFMERHRESENLTTEEWYDKYGFIADDYGEF